jgi:two-component system chemotaxis response regulator CheY
MKSLIVEDDFVVRLLMQKYLAPFGETHTVVNGKEGLSVFERALGSDEPYELVCLDIMMPEMDGHKTLEQLRSVEHVAGVMVGDGVKVIMTTALNDMKNKITAFNGLCDAYLVKPIDRSKLIETLQQLKLVS